MAWANDPIKHPRWNGLYDTFHPKYIPFVKTPPHTTWSSIEGIWQLEHTRDALAKHGLKDPWMRNEIWRYPSFMKHNNFLSHVVDAYCGKNLRNLRMGFKIAAAYIICENMFYKWKYGKRPCYINDCITFFDELYEVWPDFNYQ